MKIFLKIIGVAMFGFVVIALVLYFSGVTHVAFDQKYYTFLNMVNHRLSAFGDLDIPSIPLVTTDILDLGIITDIINFFIGIGNLIIGVLNTIWHVLQFLGAVIVVIFTDLPAIFNSGSSSSSSSASLLPIL